MQKSPNTLHSPEATEPGAGAGFSDWQKVVKKLGNHTLTHLVEKMDSHDQPNGMNAHRAIAHNLETLGLPVQSYACATVGDFICDPDRYLSQIPNGDFYFVSIKPGVHLAHGDTPQQVTDFICNYATKDVRSLNREVYISHNGEPIMSGHIIVRDDGPPNVIVSEFTVGNFNAFHRGVNAPEIAVERDYHRFTWDFRGSLKPPQPDDWRNDQLFTCNGDVDMTRPEMAMRVYDAITRIPHSDDHYLPGYYEVLLERTTGDYTRPVFIEALPAVKL